ncbi:MAG TPA: tetratricopeptide repeat protein [Stellaceae bacterium]|nr:tetratricopeptide repeat protein [Stellaceae bacterium]
MLALALGLTACAGSTQTSSVQTDVKGATMLKIADETSSGGDPATALSLYRQLHAMAPKDPVPLGRLAATFMTLQDYRSAVVAYGMAAALQPDNVDFRRGLALADLMLGDPESAMKETRTALAQSANDPRLYSVLGVAQDMTGRHDLAQQSYQHGLDLAPANIGLRNNYGMSLALAGDYGAAVSKLSEIAGPAGAPRYRLNLALAYGLAGDDAKASAVASQVLDASSVRNNLAFYALLRGMTEQQRDAAIIGSELHGGGLPPVEVSQKSSSDMVAAAPQIPVAQASLDQPTVINEAPPTVPPAAPDKIAKATPRSAPERVVPPPVTRPDPVPAPAAAPPSGSAQAAPSPAAPVPPVASASPVPLVPTDAPSPAPPPKAAPAPHPDMAASSDQPAPVADPSPSMPAAPADPKPQSALVPIRHAVPAAVDLSAIVLDLATAEPVAVPASAPADLGPPPAPMPVAVPAPAPKAPPPPAADATPARNLSVTVAALAAFEGTLRKAAQPIQPAALVVPAEEPPAPASGDELFAVQLGSYRMEATAHHDADLFAAKGVMATITHTTGRDGRQWFVLRTAAVARQEDALILLRTVRSLGAQGPILVHEHPSDPTA